MLGIFTNHMHLQWQPFLLCDIVSCLKCSMLQFDVTQIHQVQNRKVEGP